MASRGSKKNRTPEQLAVRLARRILPDIQASRGGVVVVDVSNRTEAHQRHSIRSKETETIRHLTRIEKLQRAGTINAHEAQACQWYADAYALGYDTIGVTQNYEGTGSGSSSVYCLASRYKAQQEARADYAFAKEGIPVFLLPMFERIVIEGATLHHAGMGLYAQLARSQRSNKLATAFRLAANHLHMRIAHMLPAE